MLSNDAEMQSLARNMFLENNPRDSDIAVLENVIHNKLNPEGYANLRMTKEYLQQVAKQEAQTGVKVDPSQIQKTLGEIKVKAKESVKDRKMVKARGWLNKQVEKLTEIINKYIYWDLNATEIVSKTLIMHANLKRHEHLLNYLISK